MLGHILSFIYYSLIVLLLYGFWGGALVYAQVSDVALEERVSALEEEQKKQNGTLKSINKAVDRINISGFLSVRGGQINESGYSYLATLGDSWSFSEESLLGLQMDTTLSRDLSVSIQLSVMSSGDSVEWEWGYLEYAFQPDLKFRAGRLRSPGYMLSEFQDVGYAYPWVQVPYEVYGLLPFSRYEGMDLRYWLSLGESDIQINSFIGTTSNETLKSGKYEIADLNSKVVGLDLQWNFDIVSMRIGYSKYKFELENSITDQYIDLAINGTANLPGVEETGLKIPGIYGYVNDIMIAGVLDPVINDPNSPEEIASLYEAEKVSLQSQLSPFVNVPRVDGEVGGEFYGVGVSVDDGKWLMMSEISATRTDYAFPDLDSGYILLGYRIGNWMPHFTFAKIRTKNTNGWAEFQNITVNSEIWNTAQLQSIAENANRYTSIPIAIDQLINIHQETYTLGLRWDPVPGLAVKGEVFQAVMGDESYGFSIPEELLSFPEVNIEEEIYQSMDLQKRLDSIFGARLSFDMVF